MLCGWVGGTKWCPILLLTFNCVSSSVGEGMTVGEAPRLLIATLSKAVPTGDTAGLPYQSSSVLSWKFCVISQGCNTTKKMLFSTPFDAIADFARRTTGGGGRSRRDDSRDRDLRFLVPCINNHCLAALASFSQLKPCIKVLE